MSMPLRVLIVEDSEDDALLILRALRQHGYAPVERRVDTGPAMRAALARPEWDLILSDFALPQFSGLAALAIYAELQLEVPFIVVSGTIGEETAVKMMKAGAHDYLMKGNLARLGPAVERELGEASTRRERRRAERALGESEARFRALLDKSHDVIAVAAADGRLHYQSPAGARLLGYTLSDLPDRNLLALLHPDEAAAARHVLNIVQGAPGQSATAEVRLQRRLGGWCWVELTATNYLDDPSVSGIVINYRDITERKLAEQALVASYDATLEGWVRVLEMRESETAGHSRRVVDLTLRLADQLNVPAEARVGLRRGALLHDIGKLAVPDSILLKPGPLTPEEWAVMRRHPLYACQLIAEIDYLAAAVDIPAHHHEKWDGSGYPQGLPGEKIPLAARMFALVDVWDALTSARPYRPALSREAAQAHIAAESGRHFDPALAPIFLDLVAGG